jgi:hypothetical protein
VNANHLSLKLHSHPFISFLSHSDEILSPRDLSELRSHHGTPHLSSTRGSLDHRDETREIDDLGFEENQRTEFVASTRVSDSPTAATPAECLQRSVSFIPVEPPLLA